LIHIYTDGGCSGNPGPGGWAYTIIRTEAPQNGVGGVKDALLDEKWGAEKSTTNNRMELRAVIAALEALPALMQGIEKVAVYTDSQYVQKGMSSWIKDWEKRGWKTSGKEPVKNLELWQRLQNLAGGVADISWVWVKGHSGNKFNEHCDILTQKAIASCE